MSKKLLLVEDSPTQLRVVQSMLTKKGYNVVCAKNGLEGLNLAVQEKPELIITDALMPEMDGFEMCRQLKRNHATKEIQVIMVTVLSSVRDLVRCLECGIDNYITKPFKERELITAIEQILAYPKLGIEKMEYTLDLFDKVFVINAHQQQILGKILEKMERMEKVVRESMDIIIISDTDNIITEINYGAETSLKVKRDDVIGIKTVDQYFTDSEEPLNFVSRLKKCSRLNDIETEMKDSSGEALDVTLNLTTLKTGDGKLDGYIFVAKDITEKKRKERELIAKTKRLETLSYTDQLTQLGNRRAFDEGIKMELARFKRHGQPLSLMMLDLDNFKDFNDSYGHQAGDLVLSSLADCIMDCVRQKVDYGCRHGGEEFAVILPNTHGDGSKIVADRILKKFSDITYKVKAVSSKDDEDEKEASCTVSIGLTEFHASLTAEEFVRAADIALYNAKNSGRNCLRYYERLHELNRPLHLLVVTEDDEVAPLIKESLVDQSGNLTISVAATHDGALAKATAYHPDMIVIDMDGEYIDASDIFKSIRKLRPTRMMPTIVIGSSSLKELKKTGSDIGITDYFRKPLRKAEFSKKIGERLFHILDETPQKEKNPA